MTELFDKIVYQTLDKFASQYQAAATQSEQDRIDKVVQSEIWFIAPSDCIKFYRYYLTNRKETTFSKILP